MSSWGVTYTVNKPPSNKTATETSTHDLPSQSHSSSSPIDSPVVIGGIAAAAGALTGLLLWLTWVLCRSKRSKTRRRVADDENQSRPKLPADWIVVGEQFHRAKSPLLAARAQSPSNKPPTAMLAQQFAFPHNPTDAATQGTSSQTSSRARSPLPARQGTQPSRLAPSSHPIKPNEVGKPQALPHLFSRPLSRDEFRILDHHTQTNTVPQPFTKLQPADVARIEDAVRNRNSVSATYRQQDPLSAAIKAPRKKFSIISSKHHSTATSVASSFSFASMPYRSGTSLGAVMEDTPESDSDIMPAPNPPTTPRIQPGFHVTKVAFAPLLPDEVELVVGERVTVVDVYNDGWCVVLRSGAEVLMGAVPAYCFFDPPADEPEGFERTRPPRKASLGVTVELEPGAEDDNDDDEDDAGHSSRHDSVFSWSNF